MCYDLSEVAVESIQLLKYVIDLQIMNAWHIIFYKYHK